MAWFINCETYVSRIDAFLPDEGNEIVKDADEVIAEIKKKEARTRQKKNT